MFGLLRVFQSLDDPCVVVNGSNEASTWLTQTFSIGQDFTVGLCKKPDGWGEESADGECKHPSMSVALPARALPMVQLAVCACCSCSLSPPRCYRGSRWWAGIKREGGCGSGGCGSEVVGAGTAIRCCASRVPQRPTR